MSVRYLSEQDVRQLMDMPASISVVEEAFRQLAAGSAQNVPRARAFGSGVALHTMSAAADYLNLVGWKAYTTTRQSARFHVAVYRADSGAMAGLIEADYLGRLRTGAASGVATRYLAAAEASRVGLFGVGRQAATQLEAVCSVRPIKHVAVFSRNALRRNEFAADMSRRCRVDVHPVDSAEAAAADKDIVITATTSRTPVFSGDVLSPGTHLNVIGSNFLSKAEVDVTTIRRADRIICDSIDQCKVEAGDFVGALEEGVIDWSGMIDLADVVSGRHAGRPHREAITLFKSVGLAIEDVAMGAAILDRAEKNGIGQMLPF
jgi:ornithine cyclodeaminase/alanine dehydrogenase-like protein (mu-crystallin family)